MRSKIPESLCWHVLDGISKALLWLHYGRNNTFPFDNRIDYSHEWHPITLHYLDPTKSEIKRNPLMTRQPC